MKFKIKKNKYIFLVLAILVLISLIYFIFLSINQKDDYLDKWIEAERDAQFNDY